jgi:prepilin-type N-terminal cleavage/methylation domain-containing protein
MSAVGKSHRKSSESGFSLIEVMISIVILTIGMVALLGVFATAMAATQTSQQDMIAKQLAQETIESVYAARETQNVQWQQIQNVGTGQVPDGIFVTGLQPINQAGPDGIIGTADDAGAPSEQMVLPGPDGIVGTSDDITMPLTNYQRSIAIANWVNAGVPVADLRTITITIQYTTPQRSLPKTYVLQGFISQYR